MLKNKFEGFGEPDVDPTILYVYKFGNDSSPFFLLERGDTRAHTHNITSAEDATGSNMIVLLVMLALACSLAESYSASEALWTAYSRRALSTFVHQKHYDDRPTKSGLALGNMMARTKLSAG